MFRQKKQRLGDLLLESGAITEEDLKQALDHQNKSGQKLGASLVDLGIITEEEIIEVLEFQLGIPHVSLSQYDTNRETATLIPAYLAERYQVLPIDNRSGKLVLAMGDPLNVVAIDDVKMATGMEVEPVIASPREIEGEINRHFGIQDSVEKAIEEIEGSAEEEAESEIAATEEEELSNLETNAPVVKVVNSLVSQAYEQGASDIHIEPTKQGMQIRYRIDGVLHNVATPPRYAKDLLISRVKIMAGMDITKKRIPQDGRSNYNIGGHEIDLRVSTLPTIYGEKVVIRLLHKDKVIFSLDKLGFQQDNFKLYQGLLKNSAGMVLVTGPTGCGKTTTLYSSLNRINSSEKNIITIEDPVEYQIEGINQVQTNEKGGLTFANGLRAILRQDPDIIMVGEIRDLETAQIAIRSALTGHLVFSTLHTNNAIATLSRLVDMGIPPFLVSSAVEGVLSQRLVRIICSNCKIEYSPTAEEQEIYHRYSGEQVDTLYKGKGCTNCNNTGYKGRTAIHELLILDKTLKDMLAREASERELTEEARKRGFSYLIENAISKVSQGITTMEEVIRATFHQESHL
ncbi:GspE/PulE family protein [Natranaerobius thermophilus]|uniref:Type II secretion system protein E n=1 Tax=Natranaerobius thermophilus (strain ATCC BAA-1301 / DSM 18059 / JW/NM-WN-LF) TaxID=457570 RepID=B2A7G1_NATTJ|nr:GspE/PulE family protein [Natranaerobius thermophilus]ACB85670.1 type II secretion system protein E [Natranaerobius thermophilus JW/NM-WN-LF]